MVASCFCVRHLLCILFMTCIIFCTRQSVDSTFTEPRLSKREVNPVNTLADPNNSQTLSSGTARPSHKYDIRNNDQFASHAVNTDDQTSSTSETILPSLKRATTPKDYSSTVNSKTNAALLTDAVTGHYSHDGSTENEGAGIPTNTVRSSNDYGVHIFTTEDLVTCMTAHTWRTLYSRKLLIYIKVEPQVHLINPGENFCSINVIVPSDMVVMIKYVILGATCKSLEFLVFDNSGHNILQICSASSTKEIQPQFRNSSLEEFSSDKFSLVYSFSHHLSIHLNPRKLSKESFSARIEFSAVSHSSKPQLEIIKLYNSRGYVQTPGWGVQRPYFPNMNSTVQITPPPDHVIMMTSDNMDLDGQWPACKRDKVCIWKLLAYRRDLLSECLCEDSFLLPIVSERTVALDFFSDWKEQKAGFRIYYTFHNKASRLRKIRSRWNCSVPNWSDFQAHFPCNLVKDCLHGEDEEKCPYTSSLCPPGLYLVDGKCYILDSTLKLFNWNEASLACKQHGAYLASLNTYREWNAVMKFLSLRKKKNQLYAVYLGLQRSVRLPPLYKHIWQWSDSRPAYFLNLNRDSELNTCAKLPPVRNIHNWETKAVVSTLYDVQCDDIDLAFTLCEMDHPVHRDQENVADTAQVRFPTLGQSVNYTIPRTVCPSGHVTHEAFAHYEESACWGWNDVTSAGALSPVSPFMACENRFQHIPYTLVCDHRDDCSDSSDENFCVFPPCNFLFHFDCGNGQCIPTTQLHDDILHCVNGQDEKGCARATLRKTMIQTLPPPAVVQFDGKGRFVTEPLNVLPGVYELNVSCPVTHFQCSDNGYCLPVFVRCNSVYDCPDHEDEAGCESYTCVAFFRCRKSSICVHPDHVCDGIFQCPKYDDELACDLICPEECKCYGLAFFCYQRVQLENFPSLRFLNVDGTGMTFGDVATCAMLTYLSLSRGNLTTLGSFSFPNLLTLDLSYNHLITINLHDLNEMPKLRHLVLSGNQFTLLFQDDGITPLFSPMRTLDLSEIHIKETNLGFLNLFPNLQVLNLSLTGIETINEESVLAPEDLTVLDLRGCPLLMFPWKLLQRLDKLTFLYSDNYRLCCPAILPRRFNQRNCYAPSNEISSCEALLRSNSYRIFLFIFATLALFGNAISFLFRVFSKQKTKLAFGVFVTHLCVSDFFMGLYLAIIGVADQVYLGSYLWNDTKWRFSLVCTFAGFLSLMSSEVSAYIICLITLDRFLVLRFPFGRVRFNKARAHIACGVFWIVGVFLAAVPLFPMASAWEFYNQNGICIPLPITRNTFAGHHYSFSVMIILNFVLFLFIAIGQSLVYWSIRANRLRAMDSSNKSNDLKIASRLFTVVMSDFLCWFPIGLLGLLSAKDVTIAGEVNVAMAIFVLPLNSALNPLLYTFNLILERRRRARENRLRQFFAQKSCFES